MSEGPLIRLEGRVALISGASSGLGAHFARALVAAGARVVLIARREEPLEALANGWCASGGEALGVGADVTDEASLVAAFDVAERRFGCVDTIIANAGAASGGRSTDVDKTDLQRVSDTNLLGTYLLVREAAKRMIAAGSRETQRGRVVLIGSITSRQNHTGDALYAATKAGIAHLGRQLAKEWIRQGINVNTIEPGWIETELNASFTHSEAGVAAVAALPRRRLQDRESLTDMVLYLCADRSAMVTGATFTLDDGQSL